MNYAEALVYWYLRFNGFFPLSRFVLHGCEGGQGSDCDLLGIRPRRVCEVVNGIEMNLDEEFFRQIGADRDVTIGVIVEVKGGETHVGNDGRNKVFSPDGLRTAIQRLGLVDDVAGAVARLETDRKFVQPEPHVVIAKVLVANAIVNAGEEGPLFRQLLSDVDRFVRRRVQLYRNRKVADRHRFPSELLQYLIWREQAADNDELASGR